jgi:hypothetical protein
MFKIVKKQIFQDVNIYDLEDELESYLADVTTKTNTQQRDLLRINGLIQRQDYINIHIAHSQLLHSDISGYSQNSSKDLSEYNYRQEGYSYKFGSSISSIERETEIKDDHADWSIGGKMLHLEDCDDQAIPKGSGSPLLDVKSVSQLNQGVKEMAELQQDGIKPVAELQHEVKEMEESQQDCVKEMAEFQQDDFKRMANDVITIEIIIEGDPNAGSLDLVDDKAEEQQPLDAKNILDGNPIIIRSIGDHENSYIEQEDAKEDLESADECVSSGNEDALESAIYDESICLDTIQSDDGLHQSSNKFEESICLDVVVPVEYDLRLESIDPALSVFENELKESDVVVSNISNLSQRKLDLELLTNFEESSYEYVSDDERLNYISDSVSSPFIIPAILDPFAISSTNQVQSIESIHVHQDTMIPNYDFDQSFKSKDQNINANTEVKSERKLNSKFIKESEQSDSFLNWLGDKWLKIENELELIDWEILNFGE